MDIANSTIPPGSTVPSLAMRAMVAREQWCADVGRLYPEAVFEQALAIGQRRSRAVPSSEPHADTGHDAQSVHGRGPEASPRSPGYRPTKVRPSCRSCAARRETLDRRRSSSLLVRVSYKLCCIFQRRGRVIHMYSHTGRSSGCAPKQRCIISGAQTPLKPGGAGRSRRFLR